MNRRAAVALATTFMLVLSLLAIQAAAINVTDIGFEIDGNTAAGDDTPAGDDWESEIQGTAPDWDSGPATLIQDGNAGPKALSPDHDEENIFAKGGKFGNPAGWTIEPGNTPAQNDLTNVYVNAYTATDSTSGDSWVVMGMHRIKKQGTFDLDFEFNQTAWDGSSGTLVRSEGDLVVGFELSGNPEDPVADLEVLIVYYKPDDPQCDDESFFTGNVYGAGFCEVFRGAASALSTFGAATMNAVAFDQPPWGAFDSDGSVLGAGEQVDPFFFAEAAINLSEFGIDLGCPGFGSVHAKSRSSLEVTADLKDLAGPVAFTVACYIDGYKWHDLNADGVWQLGADGMPNTDDTGEEPTLSGWTIELYESDGTTKITDTTTDSNGYYKFDGLSDGTYVVKEVCPDNWIQSYPSPNPATTCGNNTHTFVVSSSNPIHTGNFGNFQQVTLSGLKYKDADADGSKDTGEPGLSGWTITLYKDDGTTDGSLDASDTMVTTTSTADGSGSDPLGYYEFVVDPGDYLLCEDTQTDWDQTEPDPTSNTVCSFVSSHGDGGYARSVASGDGTVGNNDFGNTPLADFDVRFFDLTGSTDATISCVIDGTSTSVGSGSSDNIDDGTAAPESTVEAEGLNIGTYVCTITITDP